MSYLKNNSEGNIWTPHKQQSLWVYISPTLLFAANFLFCCFLFFIIHVTFLLFPTNSLLGKSVPQLILFNTSLFFHIYFLPPLYHCLLPLLLPPPLYPAVLQPSSLSPSHIFTRAVLPTIRRHYCQLCHLRPPERLERRRGGDGTVPVEVGWVFMVERWSALQLFGHCHKAQCLITNKLWFNQWPEYCWMDRLQLSVSLLGGLNL